MQIDSYAVAVHEAGHIVIARCLGLPIYDVTIVESGDLLGAASFDNPVYDWRRGDGSKAVAANNFAVAAYAGLEAEGAVCGSRSTNDLDDRIKAQECMAWGGAVRGATFSGDEHFDRAEARLRAKAVKLVREHRHAIERVATALLEMKTLTASAVDALIRDDQ